MSDIEYILETEKALDILAALDCLYDVVEVFEHRDCEECGNDLGEGWHETTICEWFDDTYHATVDSAPQIRWLDNAVCFEGTFVDLIVHKLGFDIEGLKEIK